MALNCTINAYPLTNRHFWRKDGNYINQDTKHEIRNVRLNEYVLVSQLLIKVSAFFFSSFDQFLRIIQILTSFFSLKIVL
jgi:hypothetical protein